LRDDEVVLVDEVVAVLGIARQACGVAVERQPEAGQAAQTGGGISGV
jgi:hypothetical protein